jgi:hypothetical protein
LLVQHVAKGAAAGVTRVRRSLLRQRREPQRKRTRFGLVTLMQVAKLPKMLKPDTGGEETSKCTLSGLPGWLGAARVERLVRNLGDPAVGWNLTVRGNK